jgi:DNA-binding NarL/FixJ family response regulator
MARPGWSVHRWLVGASQSSRVVRDLRPEIPSKVEAALAAIGVAAAFVDVHGHVIEANAAARELFAAGVSVPRDLCQAASPSTAEGGPWTIMPVDDAASGGVREYLLVVRESGEATLRLRVRNASDRWDLTRRKREVLQMVVEGHANQTIASVLGVSVRTVEVHVTALLDKAGAVSRCALAARVFTLR